MVLGKIHTGKINTVGKINTGKIHTVYAIAKSGKILIENVILKASETYRFSIIIILSPCALLYIKTQTCTKQI